MSIERGRGIEYIPTCDVCGATLPEEFDFYDAVNAKKLAGWRSRKLGGEWEDVCLECQQVEGEV